MPGRFDALTQLDKKPLPSTPPPEKAAPVPSLTPSDDQFASKPASTQTDLLVNQQTSKPASAQTRLHANRQTGKDASRQTDKPVSKQGDKPASMQAGKQVNLQTGKQVFIEKYSSYLTHAYKRELKRIAWESDRNEYEVLIEAVELYLTRHRQPK
jgi:hypothetical protein